MGKSLLYFFMEIREESLSDGMGPSQWKNLE